MSNSTRVLIDNPDLEAAGFQCWQDGESFEITKDGTCFGRSSDPDFIDKAVPVLLVPMCRECWLPKPDDTRVAENMKCHQCNGNYGI